MMYKVAIDLDNTIWNLTTPWIEHYNKVSGDSLKEEDIKTYNIADYIEGRHEELLYYILEMPSFWECVDLYEDSEEAVNRLLDNPKVDLVIATATATENALHKINRLLELLPNLDSRQIVLIHRKDMLDVDFIIDDYHKNLVHLENKKTCKGILIDHLYNRDFNNSQYGIERCDSLSSAVDKIEKLIV
ncbi:5'(3')-deoxyribonucleotidase [Clostridiales Family XIII bacterium PM5-7]